MLVKLAVLTVMLVLPLDNVPLPLIVMLNIISTQPLMIANHVLLTVMSVLMELPVLMPLISIT